MDVQYKTGKQLLLSDCLSRLSNPASQEEDESLNLHVTSIESEDGDSLPFLTLSNICDALMEDPISVLLGDLILNGWPEVMLGFGPRTKTLLDTLFSICPLLTELFCLGKITLLYL